MGSSKEILFDKFEVIECLKKDEHTGVYLADHIYLGKKIILKTLNTKTIGDKEKIGRFQREAKILAKLDHPNIIKVLDFGTYEQFFYISFEYFESNNLRYLIKDNNLTEIQKKQLVIQILKGLNYAHLNHIIHRDIKPENLLVNNKLELKISDFGLAFSENDNFVTNTYSIVGTPSYMSPEQISGQIVNEKSDLFSAGIVIYEIYCGKNPFLGKDAGDSINKIINFDKNDVSFDQNIFPEDIINLLNKLLEKNQNKRPESAGIALKLLNIIVNETKLSKKKTIFGKRIIPAVVVIFIISMLLVYLNVSYSGKEQKPIKGNNNIAENKKDELKQDSNLVNNKMTNSSENKKINTKVDPVQKKENTIPEKLLAEKVNSKTIQYGEFNIECNPWAKVIIDSVNYESTPLKENVKLAAGRHLLKLIHPNYPVYSHSIYIEPGLLNNMKINLDTLFGYLNCSIFPWGNIYIDGNYKGQTPLLNPIALNPGKHELILKNPEYDNFKKEINVNKSDTIFFNYNFKDGLN